MLVGWELYRWGSLFLMHLLVLIHTALENHLVFVPGYAPSTFHQLFPYGYVCNTSRLFSLVCFLFFI